MSTGSRADKGSFGAHGRVFLGSLVFGHGVVHWYQTSFPILLAELVEDRGMGPIAAGALVTVRLFVGGLANIPMGFVSDTYVSKQKLQLSFAFLWFGVAYFLISVAPTYALLLVTVGLLDIASALWHPPAMSTMSRLFPRHRGFAISMHGAGASVGDVVGPLTVGLLLVPLGLERTFQVSLPPAIFLTVVYLILLRGLGSGDIGQRLSPSDYRSGLRSAISYRPLRLYLMAAAAHSAAFVVLMIFFAIHVRSTLELGPDKVGFFMALLMGMSMVSQPIMGLISDRLNRTVVLLPAIVALTAIAPVLGWVEGWPLVVAVGALGLFLFSSGTVMNTAVMDSAPRSLQATAIASSFSLGMIAGSVAPLIAGAIVYVAGTPGSFYMSSALFAVSGALVVMASLARRTAALSPSEALG